MISHRVTHPPFVLHFVHQHRSAFISTAQQSTLDQPSGTRRLTPLHAASSHPASSLSDHFEIRHVNGGNGFSIGIFLVS